MKTIKSVLFITYNFPPDVGGIETRISRYIEYLGKRGILVTVIFLSARKLKFERYNLGTALILISPGGVSHFVENFRTLIRLKVSRKVDVIHVFTGATTLFSIASLQLAKLLKIRSVISFFGTEGIVFGSTKEQATFDFSASLARTIATNTSAMKSLVPRQFQGKTRLLYGGSDTPPLGRANHGEETIPKVLYVGRLVKSKGVDDLLRSFAVVNRKIPDSRLVIVGSGPEKEALMNECSKLGLTNQVEFKGSLYGRELHSEYENCSIFVLPSKKIAVDTATEALGLVLIEAAMHGKPLVGTRIGGIPEIVKDGVNGILVPQADIEKLAQAILTLLSDNQLRKKMGRNSLEMAKSQYTWEAATERLLKCYE